MDFVAQCFCTMLSLQAIYAYFDNTHTHTHTPGHIHCSMYIHAGREVRCALASFPFIEVDRPGVVATLLICVVVYLFVCLLFMCVGYLLIITTNAICIVSLSYSMHHFINFLLFY
jgi:hypothetical protein